MGLIAGTALFELLMITVYEERGRTAREAFTVISSKITVTALMGHTWRSPFTVITIRGAGRTPTRSREWRAGSCRAVHD